MSSQPFPLPPGATAATSNDFQAASGSTSQPFALPAGATATTKTPTLSDAVTGPTTALATPLSPEVQSEASGVSDIFHGNFRQGAGKIWDAEKPHVVQGSFLERAIQKIDPSFTGGVTDAQVAAHAASFDAPSRPLVDVSQFVDKAKSPVAKALAETATSFTTPANVALLYSTGGLGLVESPAKLAMASRLLSGGFSATAIASMYKNLKGFRDAYDSGDANEAWYQGTHAVASGILSILAARDALTSKPILSENPFRKTATTSAAPSEPGLVKQVISGEKVAQPAAQSALRTSAESITNTPSPTSLRTSLEEPITSVSSTARNLYKTVDDASGTDFKALNEKLANSEYQLSLTADGSEEEGKWEKSRTSLMDKIADAKQKALDAGVDPKTLDEADAAFTRARALRDVQTKVFKNTNVVSGNAAHGTPETIDVNAAVTALQKLQDTDKFGAPRLEQALGKPAADALLKSLYDAQRLGQKAISRQQLAAKAVKYTAYGSGAVIAGNDILKFIFGE